MRTFLAFLIAFTPHLALAEKAEKIDPKSQALRSFNDGLFQLKRKKYENARVKFKEALKKQPKLAEAYNNYAYCSRMISEDHYEEALKYYGAAIKLKPTLAVAYQYRGCLHILMGNKNLAIEDYKKLMKLDKKLAKSLEEFIKSGGVEKQDIGYSTGY